MNISELAERTGVSTRSLRYYEAKHLLSARRKENGYRDYDEAAVERVQTIQFYLSLGISTEQLFNIVGREHPFAISASCFDYHTHTCPEAIRQYETKLAEIEAQIAALEQARGQLQKILVQVRNVAQRADA